MNKKLVFSCLSVFVFLSFLQTSCSDSGTDPGGTDNETVTMTVSGTVFDETNAPVSGAEVNLAGRTVMTNTNGGFTFASIQVPKSRYVVNVKKQGYFKGSYADVPKAGDISNVRIYLINAAVTGTVNASSGGTVSVSNGSAVELNANSIVRGDGTNYTGNVNISMAYLDPSADNFSLLVPGGDMLAQRNDNSTATLYSYGIIKVEMKSDAGENLQIKSGNTSTITVDIPASMEATAPATIPLWYFNNESGLWVEEGSATKQGDKYVGTVSHFSDWNCDVPERTATVKGLVFDCNNLPVPGIRVKVGQVSTLTKQDGSFERSVPTNTAFDVQVLGNQNFGLTSTPVSVPPLSAATVRDVGTLSVDCPAYVQGIIKCENTSKMGQVVISWNGGYNSQFTDASGNFKMATDIGKNAQISIYTTDNKYKEINITTPAIRGQTLDLGVIEVCDQIVTGENKFTLNGSGFNNKTFIFSSDTLQVYGYYDPEDSTTVIWMYQVFAPDTVLFWMSFTGNNIGSPTDKAMWLYHNSTIYFAFEEDPSMAVQINIVKYGGVGGIIEGTFSANLKDFLGGTGNTISLTNGQFSVIRVLGGGSDRFLGNIPIELRNKIKR